MSKLKTLKDIDLGNSNNYFKVMQEAIKWIKEIRNAKIMSTMTHHAREDTIQLEFIDGSSQRVTTDEALILRDLSDYKKRKVDVWIKHFFNLTERDLK